MITYDKAAGRNSDTPLARLRAALRPCVRPRPRVYRIK